jgi:hypothetical protein
MTQARLYTALVLGAIVAVGCGVLMGPSSPDALAIQRFLATPERVDAGDKVTLLWSVDGAETVTIDHGIGDVDAHGSRRVSPTTTTTYTLTAEGGNSSATATVRVLVAGTTSPSPSPSPSPTPTPTPTPSPSATPTPTPSSDPSPSPTPSPSPSSGVGTQVCGKPASAPDACGLTVEFPSSLTSQECVQLTRLVATPACPVVAGTQRAITFDVTANSSRPLGWRRAAGGGDAVSPPAGALNALGVTTVNMTAITLDSQLVIEVVDSSGRVVMKFAVRHR